MRTLLLHILLVLCFCLNTKAMDIELAKKQSASRVVKLAKHINEAVNNYIYLSTNKDYVISAQQDLLFNVMRSHNPEGQSTLKKRFREYIHLDFGSADEPAFKRRKVENLLGFEAMTFGELIQYFEKINASPKKFQHRDGTSISLLEGIEREAKNALLFGIGNCQEMTSLAFIFLIDFFNLKLFNEDQFYRDITMDWTYLEEPGDHAYLLLRDKFGNNTVLDPWTNEVILLNDKTSFSHTKWYERVTNYKTEKRLTARIGEGHSTRWIQRRLADKKPLSLGAWSPMKKNLREDASAEVINERAFITRVTRDGLPEKREDLELLIKIGPKYPDLISYRMSNYLKGLGACHQ